MDPSKDDASINRNVEETTRQRAFEIWERHGRSGDSVAHWIQAEQELRRETAPTENFAETWAEAIDEAVDEAIDKLTRRARLRARRFAHAVRKCAQPA